jgi:flagellar hook-associated protein 1 FlgK
VSGDVETVNQQLSGIASIQAQISRLPTGSDAAKAGLISLRDQRLSELSEYISFTWTDNSASPLESSLSVRLTDGTTANLIQGSSVLDTLEVSGGSVVLANAGSTLVADGGRIGAANQLLQNELPVYTGQRDLIASELVTLVNGIYNPSGAEGQNFFDPDTATAASISLEVQSASAIVAGTDGSGNDIAREIAAIRKQDLSSIGSGVFSGTFSDVLLNEQSSLAYKIDSARDSASAQESVLEFLEQEKSSSSGVDLDYEVTQLLQFQRAYQATSRVLRTLDEVMQTFLSDIS